ncbi:MAG: efflux RND transporter periplasmic adaptor subunit [Desulfocucumaceae bacterium]
MKCARLILLLVLVVAMSGCGKKAPAAEEYLPPVETTVAAVSDLSHMLNTTGEVIASEEAAIAPKVTGRVSTVNVSVGDRVNKGQVLLVLESSESGNAVTQSEATVGIARVNVLKAQQAVADAEKSHQRVNSLYQAQAVSKAQWEESVSALQSARYGLQLSEEQLRQSEAALASARESYGNYSVTSPIAGHVASININSGELASPQMTAVTVVNMDKVKVKVNVSENAITFVKTGAGVPVSIDALGKTASGAVVSVGPQSDPSTRAFPVEIVLDNKQQEIRPGMVASLKLPVGTSKGAVSLPADAVIERDGIYYVFVLEGDIAREKQVTTGIITDQLVEIKEGVTEGQIVIVNGNRLVNDGQKVKVVQPAGGGQS